MKKLGIACDHAGYEMKEFLVGYLSTKGYEMVDFGTHSEESIDYPDFGHALAEAVENGDVEQGIGMCGSGEGMAMTLNKHQKVRASLCWIPELAHMTRLHNDSNVLVLPARYISNEEAIAILDEWLSTEFEGGRHIRRVEKIACL